MCYSVNTVTLLCTLKITNTHYGNSALLREVLNLVKWYLKGMGGGIQYKRAKMKVSIEPRNPNLT